jgi:rsbT co-antagonist protein RsbR
MAAPGTYLIDAVHKCEGDILAQWVASLLSSSAARPDLMREDEVREEATRILRLVGQAIQQGQISDVTGPEWSAAREALDGISRTRAQRGFSASETATFVFSLKHPLFAALRRQIGADADALADEIWTTTALIDSLGLYTTETFQKRREEIIARQQEEMLELSTPVVQLWHGILALPVIGTLDSARTQVVMESLLSRIVETGAAMAIIDITGVPTVDTLVAQHLLKTISAARLMGADCIISGIRPQIAQTIVHLGVDLGDVTTKATLAAAFAVALQRAGLTVGPALRKG